MVCGYEGKGLHPDLPTIRMLYCSEGFLYPELDLNYWALGFSQTAMALMDVLYSCEDAAKMARLAVYVISESMRRYRAIGGSIHVAVITEPPDGGYRELQPTEIEQYLKQNADCVGKAVDQFYA
jgi:20S proteasome alpha/beta subunit